MITREKIRIGKPFSPYHGNTTQKRISVVNSDNVPWTKRRGDFDTSQLEMQLTRCDHNENKWLNISMEETTKSHKGHTQARTLHITLDAKDAERLAKFILSGE